MLTPERIEEIRMIAEGRGIAALIEAIHYFDAEYARQFPRRAALDGPAANNP